MRSSSTAERWRWQPRHDPASSLATAMPPRRVRSDSYSATTSAGTVAASAARSAVDDLDRRRRSRLRASPSDRGRSVPRRRSRRVAARRRRARASSGSICTISSSTSSSSVRCRRCRRLDLVLDGLELLGGGDRAASRGACPRLAPWPRPRPRSSFDALLLAGQRARSDVTRAMSASRRARSALGGDQLGTLRQVGAAVPMLVERRCRATGGRATHAAGCSSTAHGQAAPGVNLARAAWSVGRRGDGCRRRARRRARSASGPSVAGAVPSARRPGPARSLRPSPRGRGSRRVLSGSGKSRPVAAGVVVAVELRPRSRAGYDPPVTLPRRRRCASASLSSGSPIHTAVDRYGRVADEPGVLESCAVPVLPAAGWSWSLARVPVPFCDVLLEDVGREARRLRATRPRGLSGRCSKSTLPSRSCDPRRRRRFDADAVVGERRVRRRHVERRDVLHAERQRQRDRAASSRAVVMPSRRAPSATTLVEPDDLPEPEVGAVRRAQRLAGDRCPRRRRCRRSSRRCTGRGSRRGSRRGTGSSR